MGLARRPFLTWRDYRAALSECFVLVSSKINARAEYRPLPHPTVAFRPDEHESSGDLVRSICHELGHHILGAGTKEPVVHSVAEEAINDILTHAPRLREAIKDRALEALILHLGGGQIREAGE